MSSKYDSFRSILDQLMGGDRDLLPDQKTNRQMHFSDDKVCKFYICGLCPHELFTNTKSDLGPCTNLHDDDIKAQYDEVPFEEKMTKYPFERDFIAFMQKMVSDLDKRIDRGHQRLSLQDHENPLTPDKMEKMDAISEQIEMLLRQMEDLGAAGRLQEAQSLELQILKLKAEQEAIKKGISGPGGAALSAQQQEKRLKVCEVCGAFLVVGDTDDRIKSHNDGKQHQGFDAIRTILAEKRKKILEEGGSASRIIIRDDRDLQRGGGRDRGDSRSGRDSYSSSSRGVRRDSRSGRDDYRGDSGRSSGRDYRDRDRDRDRDYSRDYREYRDRDRDRDSRDRRDRDRDYYRDRDGESSSRRRGEEEEYGGARKREREHSRESSASLKDSTSSAASVGPGPDGDEAERKRRRAEE